MSARTLLTHSLRLIDANSLAMLDAADTTTHETPQTPAAPPAIHERRHT